MNIPPLAPFVPRPIEPSHLPLARLASSQQVPEGDKLKEVCRHFEAALLREILRNTQKSVIRSSFSDDSAATSIYRDMVTDQLAESISHSGAFGLARSLEREFARQSVGEAGEEEGAGER